MNNAYFEIFSFSKSFKNVLNFFPLIIKVDDITVYENKTINNPVNFKIESVEVSTDECYKEQISAIIQVEMNDFKEREETRYSYYKQMSYIQNLYRSSNKKAYLEEISNHLFHYFRYQLIGLYKINEKISLEKLFQITRNGESLYEDDHWAFNDEKLACITANKKSPLFVNKTSDDLLQTLNKQEVIDLKNFLSLPLFHKGELTGIINLYNKESDLSDHEFHRIQRNAHLISLVISQRQSQENLLMSRREVRELSKFMSEEASEDILEQTSVVPGGELQNVVAMFIVIDNFADLNEMLPAKTAISLLNHFSEVLQSIINEKRGSIDKFLGPGLFALWNFPRRIPTPEKYALQCALEIRKYLQETVSKLWEKHGIQNFSVKIGLNSGKAVCGNLGATHYMDYTAIGDTINTTQRLQSNAKEWEIWTTDQFVKKHGEGCPKPKKILKNIELKGKQNDVTVIVF